MFSKHSWKDDGLNGSFHWIVINFSRFINPLNIFSSKNADPSDVRVLERRLEPPNWRCLRWSRCLQAVESPVNFTQIFVALKETFLRKANSPLEIGNLTIEFRLPKFDPKIESQNQIDWLKSILNDPPEQKFFSKAVFTSTYKRLFAKDSLLKFFSWIL